jgi:TctA family transporter
VVEAGLWWRPTWLLSFGPAEYAALLVLAFVAAITAARWSRLRAVGMTLFGLLVGVVGIDVATGTLRLTMGYEQLADGVSALFVVLGLIVVADGLVCLISPPLWLATFAWVWAPQHEPKLPMVAATALRAVAALAIAAACYLGFTLNAQAWDIGLVLVFGLFGIASKLFGWNRPVLILACVYGTTLEQSIRQSMMLSHGDPAIFFQRPISGALLVVSVGLVALIILLVARRGLRTPQFPAAR